VAADLAAKKDSILKILESSSSASSSPDDSKILLGTTMALATSSGGAVSPSTGATVLKVGPSCGLPGRGGPRGRPLRASRLGLGLQAAGICVPRSAAVPPLTPAIHTHPVRPQVAQNTISANLAADKGFDKDTAATAATAAAVGVKARSAAASAPAARRRLQQDSPADPSDYTLSPAVAFETLTGAAASIGSLLAKDLAPGQGVAVAGDASLCIGVARERGPALDGLAISFAGCADAADSDADSAPARRRLLQEAAAPGTVTMPANYSAWCDSDAACAAAGSATPQATYYADATTFTSNIPLYPNLTQLSYSSNVTLISGVVEVALSTSTDGHVCNASTACPITITFAVNASAVNSSQLVQCFRLEGTAPSLYAEAANITTGAVNATAGTVTCSGVKLGKYLAAAYTRSVPDAPVASAPAPPPASGPAAPAPTQNTTGGYQDLNSYSEDAAGLSGTRKLAFTFRFQMDYDAAFYPGGTLNQSAVDDFKLAARRSFLANVAASAPALDVAAASGALELARVQVTRVFKGSIGLDMSILAPAGATDAQLAALAGSVVASPAAFFGGAFANRYGSVAVTATPADSASGGASLAGLSTTAIIAIAVGVGGGGLALMAALVAYVTIRRRRQTLSPTFEQVPTRVY
jgi:hypothetical protein